MRVRKVCPECKKLKLMIDFEVSEITPDKKSAECKGCLSEEEYKNNNKPLKLEIMSTLAEKRAAAKLAAASTVATAEAVTPEVAPVVKKVSTKKAPVAEKVEVEEVEVVDAEVVDAEGNPADTSQEPEPKPIKVAKEKVVKEKVVREKIAKVKKQIEQIDLTTGAVIQIFVTVEAAAESVGKHTKYIDIAGKGKSKQAYGFGWRYEGLVLEVAEASTDEAGETVEAETV
jgi:hypothetical protein